MPSLNEKIKSLVYVVCYLIFKDIVSVLLAFWIEDKFEIQKFFIVHFSPYYSHYSFSTLSSLLLL